MKQRICIVVSSAMTATAFLLEPIKKLSQSYEVTLIVNAQAEEISHLLNNVTVLSVSIERKISPLRDLVALFHLIKTFKKYNFSAVHSVTPKAGLLAMLASFIAGVPIRIHTFTGQVWATRSGLSRLVLKQIDRIISMLATHILVDSTSQRQFLLDENVIDATRSLVLANGSISGVDTTRFKPDKKERQNIRKELGIKDDEIVFLFIGRLNQDKGVLDLATAFSRMVESKLHLLIVGPDESGIRPEMEKLLTPCLSQVHFIGFSNHAEKYMAASDCLCLPSYREGFGSVVIEAAVVGIPTIGSRIYGVEDAVVDRQTGLLFEARNSDELKSQMMTIASDKTLREKLGRDARERALNQFSSEVLASAWLDYYQARL